MSNDSGDKALEQAKESLTTPTPGRDLVFAWIDVEWALYADAKNAEYRKAQKEEWDYDYWLDIITNYLGRARMFGVDTLEGRQAMMKSITATIDMAAWAIEKYGKPPLPGHPSGEIVT